MSSFLLPDVGEGINEAEIVAWHVTAGDHVVSGQPLVTIETDKAVVEIPSPCSGYVAGLCVAQGDIVEVGRPLIDFEDDAHPDTGAVVGEIPGEAPVTTKRPHRQPVPTSSRPRVTPVVRAEARRLGVDLSVVEPTGPNQTISRVDVARAAADHTDSVIPLRGPRRAMDATMTRAHAAVVPATVHDRAEIVDWASDADVTVRLLQAMAAGCDAVPMINAGYLGRDVGLEMHDAVDIGVAVDTGHGLLVPVLHDVATRTAADLRTELDRLIEEVRRRSVTSQSMSGPTISLSNFGTVGGIHASLVVVPPQVAILGAGRIHSQAPVDDSLIEARQILPLSLTFDHRVVTGSEATRFLATVIATLEAM